MDFTYAAAFVLSVVVGLTRALIFIGRKGRSYWRFTVITLRVAVLADFALLLDWGHASEMTAAFLLMDAAFFSAYGLAGCAIGALPVIGARAIYRVVRTLWTK